MRRLDGFTDSMDMNSGQLQEMVRGRTALQSRELQSRTRLGV